MDYKELCELKYKAINAEIELKVQNMFYNKLLDIKHSNRENNQTFNEEELRVVRENLVCLIKSFLKFLLRSFLLLFACVMILFIPQMVFIVPILPILALLSFNSSKKEISKIKQVQKKPISSLPSLEKQNELYEELYNIRKLAHELKKQYEEEIEKLNESELKEYEQCVREYIAMYNNEVNTQPFETPIVINVVKIPKKKK